MQKVKRLWEVDSVRGIAIIMMLISNLLFDLYLFAGCTFCYAGFWFYFARVTATLFILVAGVSLTLSYSRSKAPAKFMLRGIRIFSYGLLITAVSWVFLREGFILFGILHLIGISIIISYPFLKYRIPSLLVGIGLILLGFLIQNFTVDFPWLIWAGLQTPGFISADYVPLLPWLGVFLIGIFLGNTLFPKGKRKFSLPEASSIPLKVLSKLGQRSLAIYLIHQPLFIGIIMLILTLRT